MTRKLMMITTAIVALAGAPAFAQGTGAAGTAGAGTDGSPRSSGTAAQAPAAPTSPTMAQQQKMQPPASSLTTGGAATLNRQPMSRELASGKTTTGQIAAGQAATGEVKTHAMRTGEMKADKSMKSTGKVAARSSAKSHEKMVHKTSVSANHRGKAYRDMNNREVGMTRDLNRQVLSGQQSAMAPMNSGSTMNSNMTSPQRPGMSPIPTDEAGATGPGNQGDNPTTSK